MNGLTRHVEDEDPRSMLFADDILLRETSTAVNQKLNLWSV